MAHSLFISDLHLASERVSVVQQFFRFLEGPVQGAQALYVLGDLFKYWVGDDDLDDPLNRSVADAIAATSRRGTAVYFMHGNRDLLVGNGFAQRTSATLLNDPTVLELFGTRTMLMHGDTLCTDDLAYQEFRAFAHHPQNQARFLAQPVAARHAEMETLRARSEAAKHGKTTEIMDVNPDALENALRQAGYPRLIHGHTHRPAHHVHRVDGYVCERWVLGDWYESGSYLRCDETGCASVELGEAVAG